MIEQWCSYVDIAVNNGLDIRGKLGITGRVGKTGRPCSLNQRCKPVCKLVKQVANPSSLVWRTGGYGTSAVFLDIA